MGGSGQVWFGILLPKPNPTCYKKKKKNVVIQPNSSSPKNQPNLSGWVESSQF